MASFLIGIDKIKQNKKEDIEKVCQTLLKIFEQIIANPNDQVKRRVYLDSDDALNNLMPYSGGLEILFEIGFQEKDDCFFLPQTVPINALESVIKELKKLVNIPGESVVKSAEAVATKSPRCSVPVFQNKNQLKEPHRINNNKFALKLQNSFEHVMIYEQVSLRKKALEVIPTGTLSSNAKQKYDSYRLMNLEKNPHDLNDFVLLELLSWFKNEFFKWINQPDCDYCHRNDNMQFKYNDRANPSEIIWMANNVEVYECRMCLKPTRFPRYNHPEKLLETRGGRCGEWANCFCLCLRSMNFDARYVLDWTDHVWCEVYSQSQKRWLHADPCENALDKPLIYEHGWKKKLSYIIAFSRHECIDVTCRYSLMQNEVLSRRNECDENWLAKYTSDLSQRRQANLIKPEKEALQLRLVSEIVEFLTPKVIKEGEDIGRQSGSLQWRLERGETQLPTLGAGFNFKINSSNLNDNVYTVRYSSVKDHFLYSNGRNELEIKGWKNGSSSYSNILHKIEHDWKMVYLARTQGSEKAFIEWSFNMEELVKKDKLLEKIEIRFETKCYENGKINLSLTSNVQDNETDKLDLVEGASTKSSKFECYFGSNKSFEIRNKSKENPCIIKLRADLSQGKGDVSWQHTQLFRAHLIDQRDSYLFQVKFYFK